MNLDFQRKVLLLNYEDDKTVPVIETGDNTILPIIQKWYDECDILLDIEKTEVDIPCTITKQDLSGVLFKEIHTKFISEFLDDYIPLVLQSIISNKKLKKMETNYFVPKATNNKTDNYIYKVEKIDDRDNVKELGIKVPSNLLPFNEAKEIKDKINYFQCVDADKNNVLKDLLINISPQSKESKESKEFEEFLAWNTNHIFETIHRNETNPNQNNTNSIVPLPYNSSYNVLYGNFGDNCAKVGDDYQGDEDEYKMDTVLVILHRKYLQTLVLKNPSTKELNVLKKYEEYGFSPLLKYDTRNEDVITFLKNEFHKKMFYSADEINKKIHITSQYIDSSKKNNHNNTKNKDDSSMEEWEVKEYLKARYTINNDINKKMKACELHDIIVNSGAVKMCAKKIVGFQLRLSRYLKDMGLEKKRYNDGFYYYGITDKFSNKQTTTTPTTYVNYVYDCNKF